MSSQLRDVPITSQIPSYTYTEQCDILQKRLLHAGWEFHPSILKCFSLLNDSLWVEKLELQDIGISNFITCFALSITVLTCVVCDCQVAVKSLKRIKIMKLSI